MIEFRTGGARGADNEIVEDVGIDCLAAMIDTLGANFEELGLGPLGASGAVEKMRFPGERLRATV